MQRSRRRPAASEFERSRCECPPRDAVVQVCAVEAITCGPVVHTFRSTYDFQGLVEGEHGHDEDGHIVETWRMDLSRRDVVVFPGT